MADNLIFPMRFDLEKGVADASKEWDSKYADRLEKQLAKRAVTIKLGISTKNLDNLDDVRKRLAGLKIEPITPENRAAIKELVRELKTLARIMERVQKFKGIELPELQMAKAAKLRKDVEQANEKLRLSQERVRQAEERLILSQKRAEQQAKNTGRAFGEQGGYLNRLVKRMAVYASFSMAGNFLTNVREVTAQFELQRVSLGAIIQDQQRANELFSEIKSFALKSPVSILNLTKYTKQLAAYKIGVDELFDTTKRLTDVSVGLGVSMDRIVLLYGQIRATGYLRASEVRQATEAGIPLVEELAKKLTKANGELVTAADVMDLISKRGISFEQVKEVFDDMTSAGGMFYNMQEKQGNTLYGLWAKLGDAASVMYEEIGNTESINKGMKAGIQALTDLMRNWQTAARYMGYASLVIAGLIVRKKILAIETAKVDAIQRTYNGRMAQANALASANTKLLRAQGVAIGVYAKTMRFASTMAAAFGTSLRAIKSALISTGWGALVLALGYVVDKLLLTKSTAEQAAEAINKAAAETTTEVAKSVRNFEYLAKKAVGAPEGSRQQREALEELQRTYKEILPQELMELEYLTKLKGEYGSLTGTIREYIAEQQKRKAIEEIGSIYGAQKQKYERKLTDYFRAQGWTEGEIARFWEKFYDVAKDKSKSLQQTVSEALQFAGREGLGDVAKLLQSQASLTKEFDKARAKDLGEWAMWGSIDYIDMLRDAVLEENQAIEQNEERTKAAKSATNAFADAQAKAAESLKNIRLIGADGEVVSRESDLGSQMLKNFEIKSLANILKDGFTEAGLAWDSEYGNFIEHINEKTPELISTLNFKAITDALIKALDNPELTDSQRKFLGDLLSFAQQSKARYDEIIPSDPIVRVSQSRFRQIANAAGGFRQQYNQYLMKAGEDMESYNKRLKDSLEDLKNKVKGLLYTQKLVAKAGVFAKFIYGVSADELQKSIDDTNKTIEIIEKTISEQPDFSKSKGGKESDPRLGILQEMVSTLKQVNKEYDDLAKKEGATKALADTQKVYADTFKSMQALATKYKFALPNFGVPTDAASLTKYLDVIKNAMAKLPKSDKAVLALQVDIGKLDIDEQQKKIETELKQLADRISRTKTAKEFYEKILGQTGDAGLASRLAKSIFGGDGAELNRELAERLRTMVSATSVTLPETIFNADKTINAKALRTWAEANKTALGDVAKELTKFADEAEKDTAKTVEGWLKATEKAKTYSDKLLDLRRKTQTEIDKINKAEAKSEITPDFAEGQRKGFLRKEAEEVAKLQYEAFKDSPMYVQIFDDLEHASTTMLTTMRDRLIALKGEWKNLDPTQLKEMQTRLREIDAQLTSRNPFKALVAGIKEYRRLRTVGDALGSRSSGEADEKLIAATAAREEAEQRYLAILKDEKATAEQIAKAKENFDKAQGAEQSAQKAKEAWQDVSITIGSATDMILGGLGAIGDIANGVADIMEAVGADENDVAYWREIGDSIGEITAGLQDVVRSVMSGDLMGVITGVIGAIPKMFTGFVGLFSAGRVRKANKEIKRQQEHLDQLAYSYSRLEAAADKVFGRDWLNNYNQQLKVLQAQQSAYLKQAEAERSKGKKADKDRIKEYEEQARDTADKIRELQADLVAHFTGQSRTDVARQMAKSWIDARASMSDTFAAIKGDYQEMIKNMIVEGAAARVIENALTPVWNNMERMLAKNDVEGAIDSLVNDMDSALAAANSGMEVLWKSLEARGYDMKQLIGDADSGYTGIAKDVAGATSEEINRVAAIGNTLMYYVSPIPRMDENLAAIRAMMERGTTTAPTGSAPGWTDWQQQAMDNYIAIQRNTADTVVECRRAAVACEKITKLIKTKGATSGFNVFLN